MDKRWSAILLIAICVALAGLLALQGLWLRRTVVLREAQIRQGVGNALFAVSDRMELQERVGRLRGQTEGLRLIARIDSLRAGHGPVLQGAAADDQARAVEEALVVDVVRDLLRKERHRDLRERLDARMLDSLLWNEFHLAALPKPQAYGVFLEDGQPLLLGGDQPDPVALRSSPFKERLFRHDLSGPVCSLHVLMPDQHAMLFRGAVSMLVASALFTLIIVLAFVYTLRTIRRQKRLSEIRTDLVNNLTHELKTPISTIGLACEALSDPSLPRTEDQVRTYVGMIREENKRLGSLVENVLHSAVLLQGRTVLKVVELDIHKLVQEVARGSQIRVAKRNGRIELDLRAEIHLVNGDRTHLTNLLYNLVDNAVKYTEQEPLITIATSNNNEGITVSVTDNGVGIPAGEQRKIFERLYRIPTGNVHNAKGFGLGLSYVHTVVERHGGRIKLNSAPGKGSTFHIFLPFEHDRSDKVAGGRG